MLVSLNEIKKYVDISDLTPEDIANKLTFAGIEVENITHQAFGTNLVIGEVLSCQNHPESDHLHICKVDVKDEILDIVCGAPNVRKGLKVIVAKVGAKLPKIEIKPAMIKGMTSNGMLCSLLELGVDSKFLKEEQIKGIEELPIDAPVGEKDVLKYLGLDDTILDLSLLANRSDCYALENVAREIGALFNRKVNIPEVKNDATYTDNNFKVGSESVNCPSFAIKIVKGIEIKESPKWLKNVLNSMGIRSINNIVDLGNYIMLRTGRPLHIYDLDLIKNDLTVKDNLNLKFKALDSKEYQINEGDLVVTTNNEAVCLGGILGGKNSEVNASTKNIAIECAVFNHAQIRKTCSRLGVSSDSSLRFNKGVDENITDYVLNLTTNLLKEISPIKEISNIISFNKIEPINTKLIMKKDYINNRLGTDFDFEVIKDTLEKLSFKVDVDNDLVTVIPPSYRKDIKDKADLSEEVIRYLGLDHIKSSLPTMKTTVGKLHQFEDKKRIIEDYLLNRGLNEVLTYTLVSKKEIEESAIFTKNQPYEISNPIVEDHKFTRTMILPSIIKCAVYNYNHQQTNFGLFEISKLNVLNKEAEEHLSLVLFGKQFKQDLLGFANYSYFDAKGILENILNFFNVQESRIKIERINEDNTYLHPYRSAKMFIDNKLFAYFGELHPLKAKELGINKESIVVLEADLSLLYKIKTKNNKFEPISIYPVSYRDYAFIADSTFEFGKLKTELKRTSHYIKDVHVFDIFSPINLDDKFKSIAIRVSIDGKDHTLKDSEITEVDTKIRECLKNVVKVELRK